MSEFDAVIGEVRTERVPDPRMGIFDVRAESRDGRITLIGETTDASAADALVERLVARAGAARIIDEVVRLPAPMLGATVHGLVRSAIAPVHGEPRVSAPQVSQYVLGHRLDLLSRTEFWWRVRGEDGYIGWVHHGYLRTGEPAWAQAWERGEGGEPVVSLGAELVDEESRSVARLPWGARVIRDMPGQYRLPDGRRGMLGAGELIDADRLVDRFPPRGESVIRTARRWVGTPYLWGGVTLAGVDCSGLVQAVYWMHGIALPRDSDQQARVGAVVLEEPAGDLAPLRAGDLLYFAETPGRTSHVAISLGGAQIIHSALTNGGVDVNDLAGETEAEQRLRSILVEVRRVLPD